MLIEAQGETMSTGGELEARRIEQEVGFGLWETREGNSLIREIRDVGAFRRAVGDDLVVGFAQLFTAVNKLDALHCLMDLNGRPSVPVDGHPGGAHDGDSISASKNRMVIGTFIWGVFHELFDAIETLQKAKLTTVLRKGRDRTAMLSWKHLRCVGHAWRDDLEETVRNQLAFHLGDRDVMKSGLSSWPQDRPLVFSTADGTSRVRRQFGMGFDLLFHALEISNEDIDRLAEQGIEHSDVADHAMNVFFGVLHALGAEIPSPTEMRNRTEGEGGAGK